MTRKILLSLALFSVLAQPGLATAQDGLAFKLGGVFNSSTVEDLEEELRPADAAGWSVGAEFLLPLGIAVGISGYTSGSPDDFDFSQGSLVMLADGNFFFNLPILPITAYAGLHVGLGTYDLDDVQDAVRPEVDFGDRGFQVGGRLQLMPMIGIDAQYRRVSGSLSGEQGGEFETDQFVIGVALF